MSYISIMGVDPSVTHGYGVGVVSWQEGSDPKESHVLAFCDEVDEDRLVELCRQYLPVEALIEMPRVYPGSKVRANDIVDLAFAAGKAYSIITLMSPGCAVGTEFPADWKGQVPKKVMTQRIAKRFPHHKLTNHNAIDGAGLALFQAGFMPKGG